MQTNPAAEQDKNVR